MPKVIPWCTYCHGSDSEGHATWCVHSEWTLQQLLQALVETIKRETPFIAGPFEILGTGLVHDAYDAEPPPFDQGYGPLAVIQGHCNQDRHHSHAQIYGDSHHSVVYAYHIPNKRWYLWDVV